MRHLAALLTAVVVVLPLAAQENACPCVPVTHLWSVRTCTDWNCAAAELAVSNGDPQVIAVPVAMDDVRWLVVRRQAGGAVADSGTDPFQLEQFDKMGQALARFNTFEADHKPLLMTAPDGQVLVIALRTPEQRRRAAKH